MSKRNVIVFATACILVFIGLFIAMSKRDLVVTVTNESDAVLTDVTVSYTGGCFSVRELEPHSSHKRAVAVTGESDLTLNYRAGEANAGCTIDVYIEPGYSGEINIRIYSDDVTWQEDVSLY